MKATVVSCNEWLYPDIRAYASAKEAITLDVPRGGYAATQVVFFDQTPGEKYEVKAAGLDGFALEVYRLLDVCVEFNAHGGHTDHFAVPQGTDTRGWTTRQAPFHAFDILQPYEEGGDTVEQPTHGLYLCWRIPADAAPGVYEGLTTITIGKETAEIPTTLTVHKVQLPEYRRLKTTNWYYGIGEHFGVKPFSDEWYALLEKYYMLMIRTRQTHVIIRQYAVITEENGKYSFDFTHVKRVIETALRAGFQTLELDHLCIRNYVDLEKYWLFYSPEGKKIYADTPEGYSFLAQFLPEWVKFLKENGWYDISIQHIGDEPTAEMSDDYRIICSMVRKFMPGMKFFDAVCYPDLAGSVDCWVPLSATYEKRRETLEQFRALGDEIWQYTCCDPGGHWLNRFIDKELLQPRLLHYGNYLYNLTGYLHWGFNAFQYDMEGLRKTANAISADGVNCWPAGDSHICYPGNKNGPWMSIRAEQMRLGCEDCELLWMVEKADKRKADTLCKTVMRAFDDYTVDVDVFEANYRALLCAADQL